MVKLLGLNGKIIIVVLYGYYCEINTVPADKLDFWEPNPEFDQRRALIKKKNIPKIFKQQTTNQNEEPEMYTNTSDKILRQGRPLVDPLQSSKNVVTVPNSDYNMDENHIMNKNNYINKHRYMNKHHNMNKNHNIDNNHNMGKNHNKDRSHNMHNNRSLNKNLHDDKHHDWNNNHNKKKNLNKYKNHINVKKVRNYEELTRIPKLQPEAVQGLILQPNLPLRQHPSELRASQEHDIMTIQSTRMTPMYLMQQPVEPEDEVKTTTTTKKGAIPTEKAPESLSPYALGSQMKRIMRGFSEANASIESIGRTVEYNDIILIKITEQKRQSGKYFRAEESKYIDEVPEKKIIFIVHGLSVMGMNKLTTLNNESPLKILLSYYLAHLDKFDIFLIPLANPDGYSAAHSSSLWNKNVSPQEACPGVALDRNFDVAWNATRKISSCSQLYPGPTPFSETETKAVRDIFHYHGHKILAYIHVHAGTYDPTVFKGDAILYPKGFTETQSDDDKYIDLKGEIDEAMKNASFQVMSVAMETLQNWYGKVTGSSVDYASTVYGIPYALEFVMQLYSEQGGDASSTETNEYYALTEIWSRLIDTTFNNMWKSLHLNEVKRK